jgi:hypothetical protein
MTTHDGSLIDRVLEVIYDGDVEADPDEDCKRKDSTSDASLYSPLFLRYLEKIAHLRLAPACRGSPRR